MFSYLGPAVDALASGLSREGSSRNRFLSFVEERVRPARSPEELHSLLEYLWGNVRSGHFHGGSFPLGDFLGGSLGLISPERMEASEKYSGGHHLLRSAIIVWIDQALLR